MVIVIVMVVVAIVVVVMTTLPPGGIDWGTEVGIAPLNHLTTGGH